MISLDISLVWVIINLLVLYLLLKKFLFKPVCKMMDERSAKIQSDSGLITSSITFSGAIIATGLAKLFSQPFVPFALIPATSTSTMLMIASPAVTFKSFVGGVKPSRPMMFAKPM